MLFHLYPFHKKARYVNYLISYLVNLTPVYTLQRAQRVQVLLIVVALTSSAQFDTTLTKLNLIR
jgi:hypothetical protein